jgi:hypothetical protein
MRLRGLTVIGVGLALACAGVGGAQSNSGVSMVESVDQTAAASLVAGPSTSSVAGAADSAQDDKTNAGVQKDFWGRLVEFYREDWKGTAPAGTAPARRGLEQPESSPPWPFSDWPYAGSVVIGEPDGNVYPLQTAINGANRRTKVYGFLSPAVNGSTAGTAQGSRNFPVSDDFYANRVQMGQAVLYVERLPDTVQRAHVDWGFHLTALYGTDYRFTTTKGILSGQLLKHNREYGFDPALEYVDVYFPHVGLGMNVRVGRYATIPGIETQIANGTYTYSHSLLYTVDSFSETGVLATIQATAHAVVQLGVTAGHDVAPWAAGARPSFTGCASLTTQSVKDNFYLCVNGINDAKYAYNNVQMYDGTWYHKFNKNWHVATEVLQMYERAVPSANSVVGAAQVLAGTNGANCRVGLVTCFVPEYAIQTVVSRQMGAHDFISMRSDFLNDRKGQRTGYAGRYFEETVSWNHWLGSTVQFRPELRVDRSFDRMGYDNGKKRGLFTAAGDVIYHF